jgi:outer membrane protein OmpA-like peptidoglycan-associated protein
MTTLNRLLLATTILTASGAWTAIGAPQNESRIILAQQAPESEKKPEGKPPAKPAPKPAPAQRQPQQPAAPAKPTPPATRQAPPPAAAQPRKPDQPAPPPAARQPQAPATQQPLQRREMPQRPATQPSQERRELQRPTTQTPPPARVQPQPSPVPAQPAQPVPGAQTPTQRQESPAPAAPAPRVQPQQPAAPTPPATLERRAPSQQQSTPPAVPAPQGPAGQPAPQQSQPALPQSGQSSTAAQPRRIEELRQERREERRGDRTVIREGDRTIIRQGDRTIIRRDESDRFRGRGSRQRDVRTERRGNENFTIVARPGGGQIVTVTDADGRLIRRARRDARGREVIIIDNRPRGPRRADGFFVQLPPPVIRIPRERYIVEADRADEALLYETLIAPPVERIERGYTLDEVRYSAPLRDRMPRIDVDTITFDTGSWDVTADQADRLAPIAEAMRRAIERNPNEVFLIEGHTDAVGADIDNLSLSDRRAESVANLLSDQFGIPPENLTTQGYGEQYLKIPTEGPERQNRRVSTRRITPLLTGQNQVGGPPPR